MTVDTLKDALKRLAESRRAVDVVLEELLARFAASDRYGDKPWRLWHTHVDDGAMIAILLPPDYPGWSTFSDSLIADIRSTLKVDYISVIPTPIKEHGLALRVQWSS